MIFSRLNCSVGDPIALVQFYLKSKRVTKAKRDSNLPASHRVSITRQKGFNVLASNIITGLMANGSVVRVCVWSKSRGPGLDTGPRPLSVLLAQFG